MLALQDHIAQTIRNVEGLTGQYTGLTGDRIDQANEALDHSIYTLRRITELRVSRVEAVLIPPVTLIYKNAVYHNLRAHWHASPSLILILAAIWSAIQLIWSIIKTILAIIEIIQLFKLDDLLGSVWPEFEKARMKFRLWVSDLSEAIGWGVDGFLHLLHATQGFTDVLGGLTKKSYTWMDVQWMNKTGSVLTTVSKYADQIADNPGDILEILFQGELRKSLNLSLAFGEQLDDKFRDLTQSATRMFSGLGSVADELTAIQENMPEIIRQNIPSGIWDSLETFSDTIDTQILPRIAQAERHVAALMNILILSSSKFDDLADRLAHPGTNLLGIDDLPDYAKNSELWAVDDVSSRLFGEGGDQDRQDMQADLDAFALIDQAATIKLAPIPFMTIEEPGRAALQGIVAEPQETWFVGGYNSQF